MITPIFVGFSQIGLLDYPRLAVILAVAAKAMPFFVVLVRATFMAVPRELEEAALVDGNSRVGAFFNIVLPLARNGILVCAILIFMRPSVNSSTRNRSSRTRVATCQRWSQRVSLDPTTNEWNNHGLFGNLCDADPCCFRSSCSAASSPA